MVNWTFLQGRSAAPAAVAPANGNGAAAAPGGAGGSDYSAQWAEYYRSMGKVKEAEAIEAQIKQKVNIQIFRTSNMLHLLQNWWLQTSFDICDTYLIFLPRIVYRIFCCMAD